MEGEYVQEIELIKHEEAEVPSDLVLNTSSEILTASEEQECHPNQVPESCLAMSSRCEATSTDVAVNGESMQTVESVMSPDDFEVESNVNGTELVPSDGTELVPSDGAELVPSGGIELVPSDGTELLPSDGADLVPSDGAELVPSGGTELVPSDGAELVPSDGAEVVPSDGTELVPSDGAELVPSDGAELVPSEAVERVENGVQEQVEVGVADEVNAEMELPSKEDQMGDIQVPAENSATHLLQEVSAPIIHVENHSTVEGEGATEEVADDVFESSTQQPTASANGDAVSQGVFSQDKDVAEMQAVEAEQSQPTVYGGVSQWSASFDSDFPSLEVKKTEDANPNGSPDETSASEIFQGEQKQEESEQLERKSDDENFMMASNGNEWVAGREDIDLDSRLNQSPMATLGTDYALIRRQSSESSEGRWSQEPVNRTPVEKVAAPEIARNVRMMFETGQIQDLHEVRKTIASLEEPTDSGVFENEPVQREGVVRSGEYVNDVEEVLQKGSTKNLLNQWKDKGKEEFKAEKKPINLAEDEGRVLENEPVRRCDVAREEDTDTSKELPSKGQTKTLKQQWTSRKDEFPKEQKPIKLFENESEPSVVENQPTVRTDVLREEDNLEEIWLRKGFTKNLAGFWSGPKEEVRAARDAPIDLSRETDGVIAENEPTKLEGVVRADDPADEMLTIEKGSARTMVSKWLTMPESPAKQPFQLDVNPNETGIYENEPIQLEGVVKCTAQVDEVVGQRGMIKNIAGRFLQAEEGPRKPRDMIVIDMAEGPAILENNPEPVRADVVRSEYSQSDEVQVEKGTTKNLVQKWKNQDVEQVTLGRNKDRADPSWILEAEKAAESGVFENQPQVRTDVIREVDYEPEMISAKQTRNMRAMWSKMEQNDEQKPEKVPQLVRFTPPREMTPPRVHQEEFKSYQTLTLAGDSTFTACGPSPPSADKKSSQPCSPIYSPGGSSYPATQSSPGDQTVKSSAKLVLKSS